MPRRGVVIENSPVGNVCVSNAEPSIACRPTGSVASRRAMLVEGQDISCTEGHSVSESGGELVVMGKQET